MVKHPEDKTRSLESIYLIPGTVLGAISFHPHSNPMRWHYCPLHKRGKGISEKLMRLPSHTFTWWSMEESVFELQFVQPQNCAFFPHNNQSDFKQKPDQDTPLSKCPGDFLPSNSCRTLPTLGSTCLSRHTPTSSCSGSHPSRPTSQSSCSLESWSPQLRAIIPAIPSAWNAIPSGLCRPPPPPLYFIQVSAPVQPPLGASSNYSI